MLERWKRKFGLDTVMSRSLEEVWLGEGGRGVRVGSEKVRPVEVVLVGKLECGMRTEEFRVR